MMSHSAYSNEEHIIPVNLQADEDYEDLNDDDSESQRTESDACRFKSRREYYQPSVSGNPSVNSLGELNQGPCTQPNWDGQFHQGHAYNMYHPIPPTINIFACPPPPPPPYAHSRLSSFMRPRFNSGLGKGPVQNNPFCIKPDINPQSSAFYMADGTAESRDINAQTPPPPDLTTPFHCEDQKGQIRPTSGAIRRQTDSRFHPYNETVSQKLKKDNQHSEKKNFLCVDAHDFNVDELLVKVKDKKITIEGTKPSNQSNGRFLSMKHEFTFRNKNEAKSTTCTFHPNGTLIFKFKQDTENNAADSQDPSILTPHTP